MRGWWLVFAAVVLSAHAQSAPSDAGRNSVEVRIEPGASAMPAAPGSSKLAVTLRHGAQEFRLEVAQRGDVTGAVAAQRARTGWKGDYLFVRDDCLSPAEANPPWRCTLERVFTLIDGVEEIGGKARRLIYIGEVHAGDDCAEAAKFGCSLYDNTFTDIYDKLENNPVAPREESPAPLLEMRVRNGEFMVDLDETWGRNQERYIAGFRCLAVSAAERAAACIDGITPRRAYLFNVALATYTKRADQVMRIRTFARSALCDGINDESCSEKLRLSALMLASVRPGERPRLRGGIATITAPTRSP